MSSDSAASAHPLDEAVRLDRVDPGDPGLLRGHTSAAYWNMVGPFGGVTAATLLGAVTDHPDVLGEPLALTVNFAAALTEGSFEVALRPVRTNRTNQHWVAELAQEGQVKTTATVVTGTRRETWTDTEAEAPAASGPEDLEPTAPIPGIAWSDRYEIRYSRGGIPDGSQPVPDDSTTTLWLRDVPGRDLDHLALTSMTDAFYPRAFLRRGEYLPAGTVTLTVHFLADAEEIAAQGRRPVLGTARARRFGRGYFDQTASLWSADGGLLATGHQLVYFKA